MVSVQHGGRHWKDKKKKKKSTRTRIYFFNIPLKTCRWWVYRFCQYSSVILNMGRKEMSFKNAFAWLTENLEPFVLCPPDSTVSRTQAKPAPWELRATNGKAETDKAVSHKCPNLALRSSWAAPTGALAGKSIEFQLCEMSSWSTGSSYSLLKHGQGVLGNNQTLKVTIWVKIQLFSLPYNQPQIQEHIHRSN